MGTDRAGKREYRASYLGSGQALFALVFKNLLLTLLPETPRVAEDFAIMANLSPNGGVDWSFGRKRGLGL